MEHPERKSAGRNVQVARAVSTCSSRPLSADDIQKAKMRAMYMQNKYGKADASKSENNLQKTENPKVSPTSPSAHTIMPALRISQLPPLKKSVEKTPLATTANHPCHKPEIPVKQKPILTSREHLMEMLKRNQIRWRTPPGIFAFRLIICSFLWLLASFFCGKHGVCVKVWPDLSFLWTMEFDEIQSDEEGWLLGRLKRHLYYLGNSFGTMLAFVNDIVQISFLCCPLMTLENSVLVG